MNKSKYTIYIKTAFLVIVIILLFFESNCAHGKQSEEKYDFSEQVEDINSDEYESLIESKDSEWDIYHSQADGLCDVWGSSSIDVYSVGENGIILWFDGTKWQKMVSNTQNDLLSIWGSSSKDIFTVGTNGTILHYDGNSWEPMKSGTTDLLHCVWGISDRNVFVSIRDSGNVLHYDGVSWKTVNTPLDSLFWGMINDFWGTSSDNIYAVGSYAAIFHWDGDDWSILNKDEMYISILGTIWGSSADNIIYAAGYLGEFWRFDGSRWKKEENAPYDILDIWGNSSNEIYAVGYDGNILHFNGNDWTQIESGVTESLRAIWGTSEKNIFIVGEDGLILHYSGE